MKLSYIANDIWTNFKQNFKEQEITKDHVAYWVSIAGNTLVSQRLKKEGFSSGLSLKQFIVPITFDSLTNRKNFTLPIDILSLPHDLGISYISYPPSYDNGNPSWGNIQFSRTTIAKSQLSYSNECEKPSASNPYFYIYNKSQVGLLGIETMNITTLEVGLRCAIDFSTMTASDDLDIPQDLIPILWQQVTSMGHTLLMYPKDRTNDGTDGAKIPFPQQRLSVAQQQQANSQ